MEEVAFERLPERLAWLLLDLACGGRFVTATSHNSLADMLGTYRETVSAILRDFKATGLVKLGYRKIELCDTGGLRAAAGSLPNCHLEARSGIELDAGHLPGGKSRVM